ncbi:MAG: tetratricopeptide repeat protein [Sulfuricaulis sp.]|uniref:tetratricopeptide repeat protein n=1 Tax=Sulfuricaulis sp. TaxID=2003553 RepID=UPI0034A3A569
MMNSNQNEIAKLTEAKRLYEKGKLQEALKLYLPLAEAGNIECQIFVGRLYAKGVRGVTQDLEAAKRWLGRAANSGNADALYSLGVIDHRLGKYSSAIHSYQNAATLGYSAAYYQLGNMYRAGIGFEKNRDKAFELYEEAAKRGHIFARRDIALMLVKGCKGWRMVPLGCIKWLASIFTGIRTVVKDSYSEKTFD